MNVFRERLQHWRVEPAGQPTRAARQRPSGRVGRALTGGRGRGGLRQHQTPSASQVRRHSAPTKIGRMVCQVACATGRDPAHAGREPTAQDGGRRSSGCGCLTLVRRKGPQSGAGSEVNRAMVNRRGPRGGPRLSAQGQGSA